MGDTILRKKYIETTVEPGGTIKYGKENSTIKQRNINSTLPPWAIAIIVILIASFIVLAIICILYIKNRSQNHTKKKTEDDARELPVTSPTATHNNFQNKFMTFGFPALAHQISGENPYAEIETLPPPVNSPSLDFHPTEEPISMDNVLYAGSEDVTPIPSPDPVVVYLHRDNMLPGVNNYGLGNPGV